MSNQLKNIAGISTYGLASGVKSASKDLALISIPNCRAAAGVFTRNQMAADCVTNTRNKISKGTLKAFVINSGNANALAPNAVKANKEICEKAADILNIKSEEVGVASTGVIGVELPFKKIISGLDIILNEEDSFTSAAEAILTTDTGIKTFYKEVEIDGKTVQMAGFAKGSGMIAPNMATMLGFLFTNVDLSQSQLQAMLSESTDKSFNQISVDTDTSTNDMVIAFTTGAVKIDFAREETQQEFQSHLDAACLNLAKQIITDGEGATRIIHARVLGATNVAQARAVSKSIVDSPLIKTAVHGADPNWGRVAMAIGKTPNIDIDSAQVEISVQGMLLFADGVAQSFSRDELAKLMAAKEVEIKVSLGVGDAEASAWGCDLSKKYIDINVDYN